LISQSKVQPLTRTFQPRLGGQSPEEVIVTVVHISGASRGKKRAAVDQAWQAAKSESRMVGWVAGEASHLVLVIGPELATE
jgi:hypothetical protein